MPAQCPNDSSVVSVAGQADDQVLQRVVNAHKRAAGDAPRVEHSTTRRGGGAYRVEWPIDEQGNAIGAIDLIAPVTLFDPEGVTEIHSATVRLAGRDFERLIAMHALDAGIDEDQAVRDVTGMLAEQMRAVRSASGSPTGSGRHRDRHGASPG